MVRRQSSFGIVAPFPPSSSGGAGVEVYTEVATLAALIAGRANGARLLVTADIAMSSTDTVDLTSYTNLTIAIRDGKKISHSGTADIFSASSGTCRLTIETGARSPLAPAFEVTGSGKIADSIGVLIIDWSKRLHIDGPTGAWTPFGTGVKLDGGGLVVDCGNGLVTIGYGYGKIESLIANGGGSSCAVLLRVGCGPITYRGQFRSYSSSLTSQYALAIQAAFNPTMSPVGPIQFDSTGQTYTPSVYASGLVSLTGVHGTDNSYVPRVGLASNAKCFASRIVPVWVNTTYPGSFSQCYFQGGSFESSAKCGDIQSCDFALATTTTFPSGSKPRITGGMVIGTTVFQSGSEPVIQAANVMGTVTIDSGANGRFTALQDGGGTLTNNDSLSTVTLSENVIWDTTPATRRWVTSAGAVLPDLDAFARLYQESYFDFAEAPSATPSKAPNGAPIFGHCTYDAAASADGVDGKGLALDTNDESWRYNPACFPRTNPDAGSVAEWAFSFHWKPTSSPPAANQCVAHISDGSSGAGEWDLNHLTSGFISLWNGSGSVTGSTSISAGTTYHILVQKRIVSGTPTYEVYLDGVLEISTTTNAGSPVPAGAVFGLGRYAAAGNNSSVGVYSILSPFSKSVPAARLAELAAGARLVGANL